MEVVARKLDTRHSTLRQDAGKVKIPVALEIRLGIIVLNSEGHLGITHNTPHMAWAYQTGKKKEAGVEKSAA